MTVNNFSQGHKVYFMVISSEIELHRGREEIRMARRDGLGNNGAWGKSNADFGAFSSWEETHWFQMSLQGQVQVRHHHWKIKAHLVAKGYTQIEDLYFHETFAPDAKLMTMCVLLSVTIAQGWELHQMDVNDIFLHGDEDVEVYMRLPLGF